MEGDGDRPSWMGGPGYQPYREQPPHAPMPGAPPYPATEALPRPKVGARSRPAWPVVVAAAVFAVVLNLVLELVVNGLAGVGAATVPALVVGVVTGGLGWALVRSRRWPWPSTVAVTVVVYFVLRALSSLVF